MMRLVLLSGGSGKRLWPLSNDARSKQFLKVLEDKNHNLESMVQRVWGQIKQNNLQCSTVIATSKTQVEMIHSQLNGEAEVILEPSRRDTFPAISLAASYLYTYKNTKRDDIIVVLPVDPYVEIGFFDKIKELENSLNCIKSDIALIGVKPTHPSEKYGYIVPKYELNKNSNVVEVSHFEEKPCEERAKKLMRQGALWNCGVFAFKLDYILGVLQDKGFPIHYEELIKKYEELPKISFDYEVVEKAKNIIVLPYNGSWKDLGTWNTLTEEMSKNKIGKGILSEDCKNTHLINELDIPVTVLGLSNVIVAASPDGILVSDKEKSPRIKELVNNFGELPMYEERRWGWYKILDYIKYDNSQVLTKRICINLGKNLSYHYHLNRKEIWAIIKGKGRVVLNGNIKMIEPGDIININNGDLHSIRADTELEIIEIQSGIELVEEDIVRISTNWEEIVEKVSIG